MNTHSDGRIPPSLIKYFLSPTPAISRLLGDIGCKLDDFIKELKNGAAKDEGGGVQARHFIEFRPGMHPLIEDTIESLILLLDEIDGDDGMEDNRTSKTT